MRHNLAIIAYVGAALLPMSAGWADGAKTSPPAAASPSAHGSSHASSPSAHGSSHASSPSAHGSSHASSPSAHGSGHASPASPSSSVHAGTGHSSPAPSAPTPSSPAHPAAASSGAAPAAAPAVRALPDYGGRDSIAGTSDPAQASPALNPLAQAWRAFEALAIVLALLVGGLYGLKRLGLLKPDGSAFSSAPLLAGVSGFWPHAKPAPRAPAIAAPTGVPAGSWMNIIGSQTLPNAHGATLHLVSLGGKTLLLGATAQSVTLISEMGSDPPAEPAPTMDTGRAPFSFEGFLSQADHAPSRQANETELLMNATTMRLQAMIARSEGQTNGHRS